MTSAAQSLPARPSPAPWSRLYGFGSVFAKTIRDSRRATIVTAVLLSLLFIAVAKAIVSEFATPQSRADLDALIKAVPPILQGLAGKVVNIGTMGGYMQYKYGTFFPLMVSLWTILALSGTLAGEARRGSLEFVAAIPRSRRRLALEKLAGHVLMLSLAMFVVFLAIAYVGSAFPVLPGDEVSVLAAAAYVIWLGLLSLCAGALAFALGPFIGRGAAAGIAGFVTITGYLLNGYQAPVPELAPFANLTWFGWTANHIALAGQFDWPAVAFSGAVAIVLLAVGVEAFARRDLGATSSVPTLSLPRALAGTRGPISRAIAVNLPAAIAWGLGIGLFGLLLAGSAEGFVEQLAKTQQFVDLLAMAFPGIDFGSVGGFLQLLFIEFGVILAGLAAATFVGGWAADESSGRLEMVLATPLGRARWALAGALGILVNIGVFVAFTALGIVVGGSAIGGDLLTPVLGSSVLGIYAAALAGIGLAIGGLFGARFAAPVTVLVVILTWLVAMLGTLLNLPDFVRQLALTSHYGQAMVGVWDLGGVAASIVIAVAGPLLGAWGFSRRDLRG